MKTYQKLLAGIGLSLVVYLSVALALVFYPQPKVKSQKSFDFSSIAQAVAKQTLGEESSIPMRDGTRIFFREYAAAAADTSLILLHGSGSDSRYLSQLASYLADTGKVRVITPDLRGHGRTSMAKGDIAYLGQYDDDLEDMLKFMRARYPQSRLVLGGHSSGGGLVLRYAGEPGREAADAYVFLAPYLSHKSPTVKPDSGGWVKVNIQRIVGIAMLETLGFHNFDSLNVIHFNLPESLQDKLQTPAYSYRLLRSLEADDYRLAIKRLNRPGLVVVGERDEAFYPELFKAEFATAAAAIQVDLVAGANHLDFLENQRTESLLSSWLNLLSRKQEPVQLSQLVAN